MFVCKQKPRVCQKNNLKMCSQNQISSVDLEGKDTSNQSNQSVYEECFCQKIAETVLHKIKDAELDDLIRLLTKLDVEFPQISLESLAVSLIAGQLKRSMIEVPKFRMASPFSDVSVSDLSADSSSSLNVSLQSDDSQAERNKTLVLIALKDQKPKVAGFDMKPRELGEYFLHMGEQMEMKSVDEDNVHYLITDSIEHIMQLVLTPNATDKDWELNEEELKMIDEVLQGK